MLKTLFIAFFLAGLAGCAATLPPLTPSQISWASRQWPGTGAEQLAGEKELYVERCSRCHAVVPPENHSLQEWQMWVSKMSARAKLSPDETEGILHYLAAAKAAP